MSEIPALLSPVLCYMSHCSHNRPQLRLGPSPANTAHLLIATPNMSAKTSLASSLLLTNLATSLASVAIGLGRLDPGRSIFSSLSVLTFSPQWILTPAWTQTLASPTPWDVPGASRPPVARPSVTSVTGPSSSPTPSKAQSWPLPLVSHLTFSCGAASAGEGCYLKRDLSMPYPYCCPRSFCPSNRINDIFSNSVEGDYSYPEEELQMAASQEEASRSLVPAPAQYEVGLDSEEYDYYHYDWDKIFGGFFK